MKSSTHFLGGANGKLNSNLALCLGDPWIRIDLNMHEIFFYFTPLLICVFDFKIFSQFNWFLFNSGTVDLISKPLVWNWITSGIVWIFAQFLTDQPIRSTMKTKQTSGLAHQAKRAPNSKNIWCSWVCNLW